MASFGNTLTQTHNVIVFGALGAGKSSLINLLWDENVAKVGTSGSPFNHEVFNAGNSVLFHTVDWYDGAGKPEDTREFFRNYIKLLDSLDNRVSLLIFVIKNGQLSEKSAQGYKFFTEDMCQSNVPVLLAITHCETENPLGSWYLQNINIFKNTKITDVVCGCFLSQDKIPAGPKKSQVLALRAKTKDLLEKSLVKNIMVPGWNIPEQQMNSLKANAKLCQTVATVAKAVGSFFS